MQSLASIVSVLVLITHALQPTHPLDAGGLQMPRVLAPGCAAFSPVSEIRRPLQSSFLLRARGGGGSIAESTATQARFHEIAGCATKLVDDGGVCFELLRPGKRADADGGVPRTPCDGDVVYIHYRAFVLGDGRLFEDSRFSEQRKGEPFGFTLGRAEVMQGWEIALRSMAVGDVAMVYVRNAYSFSTDGIRLKGLLPFTATNHRGAVPNDADVRFEIELLEFGNGRALTEDGMVCFASLSLSLSLTHPATHTCVSVFSHTNACAVTPTLTHTGACFFARARQARGFPPARQRDQRRRGARALRVPLQRHRNCANAELRRCCAARTRASAAGP